MRGGELAGRLSERVTLLRRSEGRDAIGGASDAWAAIATLWAAIEPRVPGPEVSADARERSPRWRVTLRRRDVRIGDRIDWGARTIEVRGVIDDPRMPDRTEIEAEQLR